MGEKIFWEVPYYRQEARDTCGIAAARMYLEYFGIQKTEQELVKETFMHEMGSWYSDLAKPFLANNLKTKIYTINVNIFSPYWEGKSKKELQELLVRRKEKLTGFLESEVAHLIKYLDNGGELEVSIPRPEMLEEKIKKAPLFIPILKSFTGPKFFGEGGHYIIVNGFDGVQYSVLDPALGKIEIEKEKLNYAWLANNRDSDGYLMEVVNE